MQEKEEEIEEKKQLNLISSLEKGNNSSSLDEKNKI